MPSHLYQNALKHTMETCVLPNSELFWGRGGHLSSALATGCSLQTNIQPGLRTEESQ